MLTIPILLIMSGILTGVVIKLLIRYIKLHYTVVLFLVGILSGIIYNSGILGSNDVIEEGLKLVSQMEPDFILYVFLPILVFDAAYEMDLHVFRKTLPSAALLAGPGLVICMLLTAAFIMGLDALMGSYQNWHWPFALMFGGLISATDPVAVVALLQDLHTSKRFSTLVDGESLLNDGTGIVCFMLFYSQYAGIHIIGNPLLYFLWVVVASVAIGYIMFRLTRWFLIKVCPQEMMQNSVLIAVTYLTFYVAQSALQVSGVIAVVVFGHYFAHKARPHLQPAVNEFMGKFWGFLADIANTFIFLIVGVVIATKIHVTWTLLFQTLLLYIALNVIRYIMIAMLFPGLKRLGYGLDLKQSVILGWGGLRGALGMCMALMVSYNEQIPEPIRQSILVLTAGTVTLTLCINGTTSKWLVNKLGLIHKTTPLEKRLNHLIENQLGKFDAQYLETLKSNPYLKDANWEKVEAKAKPFSNDDQNYLPSTKETIRFLRRLFLSHLSLQNEKLYTNGSTIFKNYRKIKNAIAELNDFKGTCPLDRLGDIVFKLQKHRFRNQEVLACEHSNLFRSCLLITAESRQALEAANANDQLVIRFGREALQELFIEVDRLIASASAKLQASYEQDPQAFQVGVTEKATRMLLANERDRIQALLRNGFINQDTADILIEDLNRRQDYEIVG